ncbi:TetR/AcrR family transcriptional regulator [Paenibacillus sediminis]|uniref:AcrR family transcriptional regulator n=1 Tax=Paenibacillus sediminis TaxID=664909 RepID=A0ABS4H303_9BACL|nr:TetR/AcrR family transcriptional regulator [Paenibacillus sediminis]MBP1936901.1 AcrR family transcriptional regulator [Paenibacillus sediminis]
MSPRTGIDLQMVIQTAAEIADQEGFEAVTLSALAYKLNIKSPSLYNHVKGLPGLRKQLALYSIGEFYNTLSEAAIGRSNDEAIIAIGTAYIHFARKHPGLYEATFRAPDLMDPEVRTAGDRIIHLILKILQAYGLEGSAALHIVRGFRSMFHGFASLEQKGGLGMNLNRDESLNIMISTFLAGLHSRLNSAK